MSQKLREVIPAEIELMTPIECIEALGWTYEKTETGAQNIHCCGEKVKSGGWIGTEHLWCPICGKGMQDMTGILPTSNSTAGSICMSDKEIEYPEDNCQWTPLNIWGLR